MQTASTQTELLVEPALIKYEIPTGHCCMLFRRYQARIVERLRTLLAEAGFYQPIVFELEFDTRRQRKGAPPYDGISLVKRQATGIAVYVPVDDSSKYRFAVWLHPPTSQTGLSRDEVYDRLEAALPSWKEKYVHRGGKAPNGHTRRMETMGNYTELPTEPCLATVLPASPLTREEIIDGYIHASLAPGLDSDPCGYLPRDLLRRQTLEVLRSELPELEMTELGAAFDQRLLYLTEQPAPQGIELKKVGVVESARLKGEQHAVRIGHQTWWVLRSILEPLFDLAPGEWLDPAVDKMADRLGLMPNQFRRLLADLAENQVLVREGRDKTLRVALGERRRVAAYPASPYVGGVAADLDDPDSWDRLDELTGYHRRLADVAGEKEYRQRQLLETPIEELRLSCRSYNCLYLARIKDLGTLVSKTASELLQIRHLGRTSLAEVVAALVPYGLTLASKSSDSLLDETNDSEEMPLAALRALGMLPPETELDVPLIPENGLNLAAKILQARLEECQAVLAQAEALEEQELALWRRLHPTSSSASQLIRLTSSLVDECREAIEKFQEELSTLRQAAEIVIKYSND